MSAPPDPLIAIETEAALLGAMLIDNKLIGTYADRLTTKDFAEPVHGRIWGALLRFHAKGAAATPVTLKPVFMNDPSALGGDYLAKLADSSALVVGAEDFAAQLVDFANRRRVRDAAQATLKALNEDFETPVEEIAAGVQEAAWTGSADDRAPTADVAGMVQKVMARSARIRAGGGTIGATNAFISDLDAAIGPLERGTYMVLAGRPGMGKSALAGSAALGYAANGHVGLYLNIEMSQEQQAMRITADASMAMGKGVPHDAIRRDTLDAGQLNWLGRVAERVALLPLSFPDVGRCSIRRIESLIARHAALCASTGKELEFVVVDYLGKISAQDSRGNEIDDPRKSMQIVSKSMADIAKRYNVAIIALAQLNRNVEGRTDKRPQLADLKESGDLEQDADIVLMVYREEYYLLQSKPKAGEKDNKGRDALENWETEYEIARGKIELIVAKNRHDQTRTRTAKFFGKFYAIRGSETSEFDNDPDSAMLF
jgi:replicative DNA helicase